MRKLLTLVISAGLLASGVAACGGATSHPAAATTAATTSSPAPGSAHGSKLMLSAAPSGALMFSTRALRATAGTVTITFANRSQVDHNLTLARPDGSTIAATPTFSGGSRTLTVRLRAGTYTYFCSVPGHRAAGMQGTLTVS